MGPKKETKNISIKRENNGKDLACSLDSPINSDSWKCVVLMAVERSFQDSFLLKEFEEEAKTQTRPKIQIISYCGITKIVSDYMKGELRHKFAILLNFSSLLQEASQYLSNKIEIPTELQVKLIKAMLFYLREDSLSKIEKEAQGPTDPIKAMAERPTTLGATEIKKKDLVKKGDAGAKVRPPSLAKTETELLKRGEGVKESHCINDAPLNGYFNLYVLLIDFYSPELPLELIKADIPFHGLFCVDTSSSLKHSKASFIQFKSGNRADDFKEDYSEKFWKPFIRLLWDPEMSHNFRNIILQVYTPKKLLCEKKERREFIYREISYLMYDMSGYMEQLIQYLANLRLLDVEEKVFDMADTKLVIEDMPNECVTVPIILQSMMDAICGNDLPEEVTSTSCSDVYCSSANESENAKIISSSLITRFGSCAVHPEFSLELLNRGDRHSMNVYLKSKALDVYYNLHDPLGLDEIDASTMGTSQTLCRYHLKNCGPNLREIIHNCGSEFQAIRRRYHFEVDCPELDYVLYSLLMTRVHCPYQARIPRKIPSRLSSKKSSDLEPIEDMDMKRPQFTVTDGSRHVLKSIPYNMKESSKDFFTPSGFKVVSPEKLKTVSAPVFGVSPPLTVETSFMSDVIPLFKELPRKKDIFLSLNEFLKEDVVANVNDFNYLEVLNKSKIINKEIELTSMCNCVDHTYSLLHDAIFVAMHNRTNSANSEQETFNEVLKTGVGLRDFFEYVLEDEAEWFKSQEEALTFKALGVKSLQINPLEFSDSDFWMADSIKFQFWRRDTSKTEKFEDNPKHQLSSDKSIRKEAQAEEELAEKEYAFEGYNIGDTIVQFSGMKTVFYFDDCNVTAELTERLYGDQVLGVHISEAGHTLHLYSYACPEPHIDEPFTFHVTYRNGIIVAFARRMPEMCDEMKKSIESKSSGKSKSRSSEKSTSSIKKEASMLTPREEFHFDMAASLPNGLTIQTVSGMRPCYIRQRFLSHPEETARLFLPNGNVVKMMTNGKIQIFKMDTSSISAEVNEFLKNCSKYEIIGGDGLSSVVEDGKVKSSTRFQVFRNTDLDTERVFFRRRDGTNYLLEGDGSLCVKFNDNTKMRVRPFEELLNPLPVPDENSFSVGSRNDSVNAPFDSDYVLVHLEITVEHPDYATTIFNTKTQRWRLRLPYESEIVILPEGEYCVSIDKQTELLVQDDWIETLRFSTEEELLFRAAANLSVFSHGEGAYVCAKDHTGKKFIIEANSNCYADSDVQTEETLSESQASDNQSTEVASTGLLHEGNPLVLDKNYFVIKKDMSGFELLHEKRIAKALGDIKKGDVVFTQSLPGSELRCFVLITPSDVISTKKWEVKSMLPDPKYVPNAGKKTTSSTYGKPPSWMHPFPKKKIKFQIPDYFVARVFLETRPTDLTPCPNVLDCSFCEVEEVEPKHTLPKATKVDDYLRKLSNNDQDILREMYTIVAAGIINKTSKMYESPSEELTRYLMLSKYYVELQEYHKFCIRYHKVPKYFHHPVGMTWLILNDLVGRLKLRDEEKAKVVSGALETSPEAAPSEGYSSSDVEYNLSIKTCQSFSSLSYHSSKSGQTAPGVIETQGVCRCQVLPTRNAGSAPAINYNWMKKSRKEISGESETVVDSQAGESPGRVCVFSDSDFDLFDTISFERKEGGEALTLEDLMCLGLV